MALHSPSSLLANHAVTARGKSQSCSQKLVDRISHVESSFLSHRAEFVEHRDEVEQVLARLLPAAGASGSHHQLQQQGLRETLDPGAPGAAGITTPPCGAEVAVATIAEELSCLTERMDRLEAKITRASELACDVCDQQVQHRTQANASVELLQRNLTEHRTDADARWQDLQRAIDNLSNQLEAVRDRVMTHAVPQLHRALALVRSDIYRITRASSVSDAKIGNRTPLRLASVSGGSGGGAAAVCSSGDDNCSDRCGAVTSVDLVAFTDLFLRRLGEILAASQIGEIGGEAVAATESQLQGETDAATEEPDDAGNDRPQNEVALSVKQLEKECLRRAHCFTAVATGSQLDSVLEDGTHGFLKAHSGDGGACHRGAHAGTYVYPERQVGQENIGFYRKLWDIFQKCDLNKDGCINRRGLLKVLQRNPEIVPCFGLPDHIRLEDSLRSNSERFSQGVDDGSDDVLSWIEFRNLFCTGTAGPHRVETSRECTASDGSATGSPREVGGAKAGARVLGNLPADASPDLSSAPSLPPPIERTAASLSTSTLPLGSDVLEWVHSWQQAFLSEVSEMVSQTVAEAQARLETDVRTDVAVLKGRLGDELYAWKAEALEETRALISRELRESRQSSLPSPQAPYQEPVGMITREGGSRPHIDDLEISLRSSGDNLAFKANVTDVHKLDKSQKSMGDQLTRAEYEMSEHARMQGQLWAVTDSLKDEIQILSVFKHDVTEKMECHAHELEKLHGDLRNNRRSLDVAGSDVRLGDELCAWRDEALEETRALIISELGENRPSSLPLPRAPCQDQLVAVTNSLSDDVEILNEFKNDAIKAIECQAQELEKLHTELGNDRRSLDASGFTTRLRDELCAWRAEALEETQVLITKELRENIPSSLPPLNDSRHQIEDLMISLRSNSDKLAINSNAADLQRLSQSQKSMEDQLTRADKQISEHSQLQDQLRAVTNALSDDVNILNKFRHYAIESMDSQSHELEKLHAELGNDRRNLDAANTALHDLSGQLEATQELATSNATRLDAAHGFLPSMAPQQAHDPAQEGRGTRLEVLCAEAEAALVMFHDQHTHLCVQLERNAAEEVEEAVTRCHSQSKERRDTEELVVGLRAWVENEMGAWSEGVLAGVEQQQCDQQHSIVAAFKDLRSELDERACFHAKEAVAAESSQSRHRFVDALAKSEAAVEKPPVVIADSTWMVRAEESAVALTEMKEAIAEGVEQEAIHCLEAAFAEHTSEIADLKAAMGSAKRRSGETSRSVAKLHDEINAVVLEVETLSHCSDHELSMRCRVETAELLDTQSSLHEALSQALEEQHHQLALFQDIKPELRCMREARAEIVQASKSSETVRGLLHEVYALRGEFTAAEEIACNMVHRSVQDASDSLALELRQFVTDELQACQQLTDCHTGLPRSGSPLAAERMVRNATESLADELRQLVQDEMLALKAQQQSGVLSGPTQQQREMRRELLTAAEALQSVSAEICAEQDELRHEMRCEAANCAGTVEKHYGLLLQEIESCNEDARQYQTIMEEHVAKRVSFLEHVTEREATTMEDKWEAVGGAVAELQAEAHVLNDALQHMRMEVRNTHAEPSIASSALDELRHEWRADVRAGTLDLQSECRREVADAVAESRAESERKHVLVMRRASAAVDSAHEMYDQLRAEMRELAVEFLDGMHGLTEAAAAAAAAHTTKVPDSVANSGGGPLPPSDALFGSRISVGGRRRLSCADVPNFGDSATNDRNHSLVDASCVAAHRPVRNQRAIAASADAMIATAMLTDRPTNSPAAAASHAAVPRPTMSPSASQSPTATPPHSPVIFQRDTEGPRSQLQQVWITPKSDAMPPASTSDVAAPALTLGRGGGVRSGAPGADRSPIRQSSNGLGCSSTGSASGLHSAAIEVPVISVAALGPAIATGSVASWDAVATQKSPSAGSGSVGRGMRRCDNGGGTNAADRALPLCAWGSALAPARATPSISPRLRTEPVATPLGVAASAGAAGVALAPTPASAGIATAALLGARQQMRPLCVCGNALVPDAMYCNICGLKRAEVQTRSDASPAFTSAAASC